jgi:hypothetical protein
VYEAVFDPCDAGERVADFEAQPHSEQRERVTTIEIEVEGRWDALALSELLIPFHSFLVQHDQERWVVHARAPGCHGERLPDALKAVEEWRAERGPRTAALCRIDGRTLRPTRVA